MKRKIAVVFCALVLVIALCACSPSKPEKQDYDYYELYKKVFVDGDSSKLTQVATAAGEPIYYEYILMRKAVNQMSYDINKPMFNTEAGKTANLEEISTEKLNMTEKEILNEFIETAVLTAEAKKLGLFPSYDEAYKSVAEPYFQVKELNDENYAFYKALIEKTGVTEEQYLKSAALERQKTIAKYNLSQKYENDAELKAKYSSFEVYTQALISSAEITITKDSLK